MTYRELLVMRKALMWYFLVVFALCIWLVFWMFTNGSAGGHSETDLDALVFPSASAAALFAAIFGVALGNGSRDAARVLWTLPVSRWKLAIRTIAVDLGAAVVAFAGTFLLLLLTVVVQGLGERVELRGPIDWLAVVTALAFVFAVYGWSALIGMLGRRVAYLAIASYPLLLVWWLVSHSRGAIGALLRGPVILNPVAVYSTAHRDIRSLGTLGNAVASLGPAWTVTTLAVIFVLTCGTAVYLWQRAEVLN